jgi:hypothetical protein
MYQQVKTAYIVLCLLYCWICFTLGISACMFIFAWEVFGTGTGVVCSICSKAGLGWDCWYCGVFCGRVELIVWLASIETLSSVENCCGLGSSLGAGDGRTLSSSLVVIVSKDDLSGKQKIQYSTGQISKVKGWRRLDIASSPLAHLYSWCWSHSAPDSCHPWLLSAT